MRVFPAGFFLFMRRLLPIIGVVFLFALPSTLHAIKRDTLRVETSMRPRFLYNVDFATYFDNREYKSPYQTPRTIFAFRLSPEIGVKLHDHQGGTHRLMAGVHYTQPLGTNWSSVRFSPTAYYRYDYKGFSVALGAIPFTHRIEMLPDWLQYDSIAYARPNVQGALMSYVSSWGFAEFMCDWRGAQLPEQREMFRLVINGEFRWKWLRAGGYFTLNHKANYAPPTPREGVCDDIFINPHLGVDFSEDVPLDSLALRVGYIYGIQNHRSAHLHQTPQGMLLEFYLNWRFFGLRNQFYYGANLLPYYADFKSDLHQGDPFFQSPLYNRTDVFAYIYRNNFVNCSFSWNFHYDGIHLQHQQQLNVYFSLAGWSKNKTTKQRGLLGK